MTNRLCCLLILLSILTGCKDVSTSFADLNLNGKWEYGLDREYQGFTQVPGITLNPEEITDGTLWYKRTVELPSGDWNTAILELKGARFRPTVYVNGEKVSYTEGGMTRTFHKISGMNPGDNVTLEVALKSLAEVPVEDASYIPGVDQWRSNSSSCIWDDVVLHLYKDAAVDRVLVFADTESDSVTFRYRIDGNSAVKAEIAILDGKRTIKRLEGKAECGENEVSMSYKGILDEWTPETPNTYILRAGLVDSQNVSLLLHRGG